jgi:hypothetical protein
MRETDILWRAGDPTIREVPEGPTEPANWT